MKPIRCALRLAIVLIALATTRTGPPECVAQDPVMLFNGEDLSGWEGNTKLWTVRDGMIVGESPGISDNEFLATTRSFGNFELSLEFRMHGGRGNSGIQFRSRRVPGSKAVEGYQADIGERFWGCLYDEHRRRKVLVRAPRKLDDVLEKDGWNTYVIRAQGDHVTLSINGLTTVDSGPAMRIDFRNLQIKDLSEN